MRAVDVVVLGMVLGTGYLGCARQPARPAATHAAPATVDHRVEASALTRVHLTAEAAARLGVAETVASSRALASTRELGAELLAQPGRALTLTAPVAGSLAQAEGIRAGARVVRGSLIATIVPMAPADRDLRAQADQGVATAAARLEAAEARAVRAEALARTQAGSVRAVEEARADREVALAALNAARARRGRLVAAPLAADVRLAVRAPYDGVVRQAFAVEGQLLSAGAPMLELVALDPLWVRVPVYVGDLSAVDRAAPVQVRTMTAEASEPGRRAEPVMSPPTADAAAITRDLYYAMANPDGAAVPGERVMVRLPLRSRATAVTLPTSAIVWDTQGGAWVYATTGPRTYTRRRVAIDRVDGDVAVLARGVDDGDRIVTVGAAELFGVEFGAGH